MCLKSICIGYNFCSFQPAGADGSAASMVEVGVWAIIAKVRTIRRQQQYLTDLQGESGGILLGDGHRHWGASSIFHGEGGKALRCVLARYYQLLNLSGGHFYICRR